MTVKCMATTLSSYLSWASKTQKKRDIKGKRDIEKLERKA
jgi:hypothetical protein